METNMQTIMYLRFKTLAFVYIIYVPCYLAISSRNCEHIRCLVPLPLHKCIMRNGSSHMAHIIQYNPNHTQILIEHTIIFCFRVFLILSVLAKFTKYTNTRAFGAHHATFNAYAIWRAHLEFSNATWDWWSFVCATCTWTCTFCVLLVSQLCNEKSIDQNHQS